MGWGVGAVAGVGVGCGVGAGCGVASAPGVAVGAGVEVGWGVGVPGIAASAVANPASTRSCTSSSDNPQPHAVRVSAAATASTVPDRRNDSLKIAARRARRNAGGA